MIGICSGTDLWKAKLNDYRKQSNFSFYFLKNPVTVWLNKLGNHDPGNFSERQLDLKTKNREISCSRRL
jgi:hypothetical protein